VHIVQPHRRSYYVPGRQSYDNTAQVRPVNSVLGGEAVQPARAQARGIRKERKTPISLSRRYGFRSVESRTRIELCRLATVAKCQIFTAHTPLHSCDFSIATIYGPAIESSRSPTIPREDFHVQNHLICHHSGTPFDRHLNQTQTKGEEKYKASLSYPGTAKKKKQEKKVPKAAQVHL